MAAPGLWLVPRVPARALEQVQQPDTDLLPMGCTRLAQCRGTTQPVSGGRGHLGRSRFLPGAACGPSQALARPQLPQRLRGLADTVGHLGPPAGLEDDPQAVLQTIRRYVHVFFGCKECGEHFEEMAKESIDSVKTPDQAILWLWKKHNLVNSRLAGEQKPLGGPCLRGACVGGRGVPEPQPAPRRCPPTAGSSVPSGVGFLVTLAGGWQAPDAPTLQGSQPRGGGRALPRGALHAPE